MEYGLLWLIKVSVHLSPFCLCCIENNDRSAAKAYVVSGHHIALLLELLNLLDGQQPKVPHHILLEAMTWHWWGLLLHLGAYYKYSYSAVRSNWVLEVEIVAWASSCLADALVICTTWYTTGNIHAFSWRLKSHSFPISSLLLVDVILSCFICYFSLLIKILLGTAYFL